MHHHASTTRRSFLVSAATLTVAGPLLIPAAFAQPTPNAPPPPKPPALPPDKVQSTVGLAHRDLEGVKRLVDETPLLVNATWDWGGGDFETPLQAAGHTGQRAIAEFLLSRGARIDLFAAAMLGQLDLIKAAFATDPKALEIPGPHGFTMLHCAQRGGDRAKPVYDWMLAQGVPELMHRPLPFKWPEGAAPANT